MSRLPFDPERMRAAEGARGPAAPGASGRLPARDAAAQPTASDNAPHSRGETSPIRVSELARWIKRALADGLPATVKLRGEMSGLRRQTHWYFQLKDDDAVIGGVMFASAIRNATADLNDGDEVVVTGRVDFWEKGGRTQFYADRIEHAGDGAWRERLKKLVDRARDAGYLDAERKRRVGLVPRNVAIVTSPTGAALQDVLITMQRRCPAVGVYTLGVRVQGDGAHLGIARAIDSIADRHDRIGIDAVVVTRGGGSVEDLWSFNEWAVAEAIARCPVPVIAAIGHETDTTLAELVADLRCATPTQAAMHVTPDRDALAEQLGQLAARLRHRLRHHIDADRRHLRSLTRRPALADASFATRLHRDRLDALRRRAHAAAQNRLTCSRGRTAALGQRLAAHRPEAVYARRAARLDAAARRLRLAIGTTLDERAHDAADDDAAQAIMQRLYRERDRLTRLERELVLASPRAVLKRGYSMTRRSTGAIVRSADDVTPGDRLQTVLAAGAVWSTADDAHTRDELTARPVDLGREHATPKRNEHAALTPRGSRPKRRGKRPSDDRNQMGLF